MFKETLKRYFITTLLALIIAIVITIAVTFIIFSIGIITILLWKISFIGPLISIIWAIFWIVTAVTLLVGAEDLIKAWQIDKYKKEKNKSD